MNKTWRRVKIGLGVTALIVVSLLVYAFLIEPDQLIVNEVALSLPRWPAELSGLRIVAISDLHAGAPHIDDAKLEQVVAEINRLNPDLVVLLGDFVVGGMPGREFITPEATAAKLKNLRAPGGVYAVLGNHDWWEGGPQVMRALQDAGIRVLENDAASVRYHGQTVWLVGLADLWTRRPDVEGSLAKVMDTGPVIALTHNPDVFPGIPPRVALTLAGHTHGGQVNLPLLGRLVVPSNFGARYAIGHVEEDGRHLYITPGIGTSILPVRFRVRPEITLLKIMAGAGGA